MRSFLNTHRLAGWLSWRPDELVLQIGHLPYWGLSVLLFLADGERILFVPELDPEDSIPDDVTVVRYPWGRMDCAEPFAVLRGRLDDELRKRKLEKSHIGALLHQCRSSLPVMAAEQPVFPPEDIEVMVAGTAQSAAASAAFVALYLLKTPAEIEHIRLADSVARVGLDAWKASLQPGLSEAHAAAVVEGAVHRLTGINGIHMARAWAMVQSGPNTVDAGRFNRSSGRRFEEGDLVLIEMATCVNGYWSDLTRTAPVGRVSAERSEVLAAVAEAQQAALRLAAPGVSAHDVDATARGVLERAGLGACFTHATGHHVGFRYHDPGFGIAPGCRDTLQEGMVITIEPGAYVQNRLCGARLEDNVAITATGTDVLSDSSPGDA
jgi:Xaa-Pro aminopeptidase